MPLFNMKRRTLRPFDAIFVLFTLGAIGLEGTAYRNEDLSSRAGKHCEVIECHFQSAIIMVTAGRYSFGLELIASIESKQMLSRALIVDTHIASQANINKSTYRHTQGQSARLNLLILPHFLCFSLKPVAQKTLYISAK